MSRPVTLQTSSRARRASTARGPTWLRRVRHGGLSQLVLAIPLLLAVGGAALAAVLLGIDAAVDERVLPEVLRFGEENARSLLTAIAGGLLTVVVLVFWVRMVAVQMSSSMFSARTLQGFLRDRFQQMTMGLVIGALAYMVMVTHAIPDQEAGMAQVPHLSVLVGTLAGVGVAVLVIESVREGARSSQTGVLLRRIADDVVAVIRELHPERGERGGDATDDVEPPGGDHHVVVAKGSGWVQRVDEDALLLALPADAVAELEVRPGHFVTDGTPLCRVWPMSSAEVGESESAGDDGSGRDGGPDPARVLAADVDDRVRSAVTLGDGPTLEHDIGFGVRTITDVAERALAPDTGDVSAAEEAIVRIGVVLRELMLRDLPAPHRRDGDGRVLLRPHELDRDEYVSMAFDRIRMAGASSPDVAVALLTTMGMLTDELHAAGLAERAEPLRLQAELLLQEASHTLRLPDDLERLREVAERRGLVGPTREPERVDAS